jgi:hypothetical protein
VNVTRDRTVTPVTVLDHDAPGARSVRTLCYAKNYPNFAKFTQIHKVAVKEVNLEVLYLAFKYQALYLQMILSRAA